MNHLTTLREVREALDDIEGAHSTDRESAIECREKIDRLISEYEAAEPVAEWMQVDGYEGTYSVSASGKVRNDKTGRVLKQALAGAGYPFVSLWKDGKGKQFYIHRLVATAFLPREDWQNEVNHVDGNKLNNDVSNLEWCTRSDNTKHARHILNLPQGGLPPREIVAIDCATGEKTVYPSIEAPARSGYVSAHIYRCLKETHRSHKGKKWVREEAHPAPTGFDAGDMATAAADGFRDGVASEVKPTSEAGLPPLSPNDHPDPHSFRWSESEMRAIQSYAREAVAQAVEREREACAISCEVNAARWVEEPDAKKWYAAHECAAAIRSRQQGGAA